MAAITVTMTIMVPARGARAADDCSTQLRQDGRHKWVTPYLATGFGWLARTTNIDDEFRFAGEVGFRTPKGAYSSDSDALRTSKFQWWSARVIADDTGQTHSTVGFASFDTPYGPTVWATQFNGSAGCVAKRGRWGTWNLVTGRFYPSGPWVRVDGDGWAART